MKIHKKTQETMKLLYCIQTNMKILIMDIKHTIYIFTYQKINTIYM